MLQPYQCSFVLLPSMQHPLSHARMMGQLAGASQVDDLFDEGVQAAAGKTISSGLEIIQAHTWPVQDPSVALRRP